MTDHAEEPVHTFDHRPLGGGLCVCGKPIHTRPDPQFDVADEPCPFCEIAAGRAPATVVADYIDVMVIVPLNPVTRGHVLVIPRRHAHDVRENIELSAQVMRRAAWFAHAIPEDVNLITSAGPSATQTVMHLHMHVVPRRPGDGLSLPWTGQQPARQ